MKLAPEAAPQASGDRRPVLGIDLHGLERKAAVERIIAAAQEGRPLAATALAVHGVMAGVLDGAQRARLNSLDLVLADGQPVRWALRWLHGVKLRERVYGPALMLDLCERAAAEELPIYLYGSTPPTVLQLATRLTERYPQLRVAGARPSQFRTLSADEQGAIAREIRASGARLVFVGLGCPRQEVWVYENRDLLPMPLVAVGAAFDFHAGALPQAPGWMQQAGLEWLFRLAQEPRRLWRRYLLLNPVYAALVAAELGGLRLRRLRHREPPRPLRFG